MNAAAHALRNALLLVLFCLTTARAGAPPIMTYQGQLQESGSPVSGNRDMNINLCGAASGPGCFPTGTQGVAVATGLYRTTFTVPSTVDLNSGAWYLEVQVGPSGGPLTTLSPREQLTSSPYAIAASSVPAEGILSGTVGAGVNFSGAVGIGTTGSPTGSLLEVVGDSPKNGMGITSGGASSPIRLVLGRTGSDAALAVSAQAGNFMTGSAPGDLILETFNAGAKMHFATGNGASATSRLTIENTAGNVGIGTLNPAAKLDVVGTINGQAFTVNGTPFAGSQWATAGSSISYSGGNVGIGTANPARTLDVVGTVRATSFQGDGSALTGVSATDGTKVAKAGDTMTGTLTLSPTSGPAFVTTAGSVGIGTTAPAPSTLIDVVATGGQVRFKSTSSALNGQFISENDAGHQIGLAAMGSAQGGTIFGGPFANAGALIGGTLSKMVVGTQNAAPLLFGTNDVERARITPAGNVGIGTASPTSRLQVVGLPVFANNAAALAGGLTAGAFYRTGGDPDLVAVVH